MIHKEGPKESYTTPCCGVKIELPGYPFACPCPPPRGMGEIIHSVAKWIVPKKAKECVPCNERRAALNQLSKRS